jgi:ABC-type multidrug transport system ATPase subunit
VISESASVAIPPTIVPGIVRGAPVRYLLTAGTPLGIGRDSSNGVRLRHPQVSRFHARIDGAGGRWQLTDRGSSNGTFLNDRPITAVADLAEGDRIRIADFLFIFTARGERAMLQLFSEEGNARLDAVGLRRDVGHGQLILRDVSLSILPREFVCVVGVSGAGKSTLVNALSGFRPADRGVVLLNGVDFYANLEALRESLGFVPQDDIIHRELTVYQALYYAALLRLPEDMARGEIEDRIEQVLGELQLTERRNLPVTRLSGGQRKRVSIGVELLTQPRLFYLDEPTSGLDPGLEGEMMRLFRRLADGGHTLIVITHATTNIHLCDQLVFLARGGALAYYGPPAGALRYFGVKDFPDIYAQVESLPPEEWEQRYRGSDEYRTLVRERLSEVPPAIVPGDARAFLEQRVLEGATAPGPLSTSPPPPAIRGYSATEDRSPTFWQGLLARARADVLRRTVRRTGQMRQFFILARRYLEIVWRDRRNLVLMLMQAPIIAWLLAVVFDPDIFDVVNGNFVQARTLLFLMVCCSIWFGTSNAAREICKERAIYRRERSANLKIAPYVFSKVAVLFILCVIQSASMVFIIRSRIALPDLGPVMLEKIFLILLLASVGGLATGLLLSALVSNPDKAGSLVPIILIPQLVLAGALIPLKGFAQDVSYLMLSKWGYEMIGQATRLQELPRPPVMSHVEIEPALALDISFAGHFWVLVGFIGLLLLATCLVLARGGEGAE